MRVSKEKAAANHQQILEAAARLFRERGISATGVDAITSDVGLTHGGLYSQFGSKDAIAVEAIAFAAARSKRLWNRMKEREPGPEAFATMVESYLSRAHRDAPGRGCVMAALGADVAHQSVAVRGAFTAQLKRVVIELAGLMPSATASEQRREAIAAFAGMVGAIILARAVNDKAFSDLILKSAARETIAKASATRRRRRQPHRGKLTD
jgi:TetR/AcrR family transcriptional repressor of nem operon